MNLDECDRHFQAIRKATSASEVCHLLEPLLDTHTLMSVDTGRQCTFYRARAAGLNPWDDPNSMRYPPAEYAMLGRLNDKHMPIFYAATREETALLEINVKSGMAVQVAGFRIRHHASISLAVIGELFHVHKTGYMRAVGIDPGRSFAQSLESHPYEEARSIMYIDAFLGSLLADPKAVESDYLVTRAVASMVFRRSYIDGFLFPSVKDPLGMNLALKPEKYDANLEMICCSHGAIEKVREFGVLDYARGHAADMTDPSGPLEWSEETRNARTYFNLSEEEYGQMGHPLGP